MTGRPINESRAIAVEHGLSTYTGAPHVRCDTTERYVLGGGCVHCARQIAKDQRAALMAIKRGQIVTDETIQEQIDNHDEFSPPVEPDPVDIEQDDGLDTDDPDDAEARRLADIEELI